MKKNIFDTFVKEIKEREEIEKIVEKGKRDLYRSKIVDIFGIFLTFGGIILIVIFIRYLLITPNINPMNLNNWQIRIFLIILFIMSLLEIFVFLILFINSFLKKRKV